MKSVVARLFKGRQVATLAYGLFALSGLYVQAASGGAPLLWLQGVLSWWLWRCPLQALFGVTCPTCGLGRAMIYAWTGQWQLSWHYHPGALILLAVAAFSLVAMWWPRSAASPSYGQRLWLHGALWLRKYPYVITGAVALYCLWGFGRSLPL